MTVVILVETVVLALLSVLAVGLLHSHAAALRQLKDMGGAVGMRSDSAPGIPVSFTAGPSANTAHDVRGETSAGKHVAVALAAAAGAPARTLLAFLSTGCTTCGPFWQAAASATPPGLPAGTRVLAITRGPRSESVSAVGDHELAGVPVVMSDEAWEQYGVPGSPYFVLVDGAVGRVIAEGTAERWGQLTSLLTHALDAPAATRPSDRQARVDAELLAAGIGPGHPSLHPDHHPDEDGTAG
jgi:hypothetical protein